MKPQILFRKIHHWGSFTIAIPMVIVIVTGILLQVKKEIEWVQPPTSKGVERTATPTMPVNQLFEAAKAIPEMELKSWDELERADFKPGKGVVKFVAPNNWEAQIDTHTGEVLALNYRRSDIIEKIHDGSWFADWAKLWLFLPNGIALFILWLTGMYLFALPHIKKAQKKKKKKS